MNWALKRQLLYGSIALACVAFLAFLIIYPYFNKAPICTDGKQNGTETGVDCGGSCQLACVYQVDELSILWARAFRVVPGRYNAVAYLENHNPKAAIYRINYRFRFADKDNVYIGKREGQTFIPPSGKFGVFEAAIDLGNSVPVYTTFEFSDMPTWIQTNEATMNELNVSVTDIKLEDESTSPRLSAVVKNDSLFQIPAVNVIAILYDAAGNAVNASRTFIDQLDRESGREVNFTWVEPFTEKIIQKEIIPMYDIFSVKLK